MVAPNIADHSLWATEGQAAAFASSKPAQSVVSRSSTTSSDRQQSGSSPCSAASAAAVANPAASNSAFRPLRFLQLVTFTGFLAAAASVLGKLACSFSPSDPLQQFSASLLRWLCPSLPVDGDVLLVQGDADSGFTQFNLKPDGFGALVVQIGRAAVLLATSGPRCKFIGVDELGGEVFLSVVACFFSAVLLLRACLFGCMLACNGFMLNFHVKSLLVAPSAGSSSVAVFASNFLFSVVLSCLLLGEHLSCRVFAGAACMLLGVALLSASKTRSHY